MADRKTPIPRHEFIDRARRYLAEGDLHQA